MRNADNRKWKDIKKLLMEIEGEGLKVRKHIRYVKKQIHKYRKPHVPKEVKKTISGF